MVLIEPLWVLTCKAWVLRACESPDGDVFHPPSFSHLSVDLGNYIFHKGSGRENLSNIVSGCHDIGDDVIIKFWPISNFMVHSAVWGTFPLRSKTKNSKKLMEKSCRKAVSVRTQSLVDSFERLRKNKTFVDWHFVWDFEI